MKLDAVEVLSTAAPGIEAPAAGWRRTWPLIVAALAAILAIYRETAASMIGLWASSETYAHGYLIVPIALALIWRKRRELAAIEPRPDYAGFALLAAAGFAWLVAAAGQVQVLQQYALAAMLPAAGVALAGRRAALTIAFPLAFLLLAVPFGEAFLPRLMDWTADFTVAALRLTGIPVYREGTFFSLPSGQWSVVEACSGLRYLIASVTVGALFAYLNYQRAWKRALFMALAIAVPIVANFLRAYLIVMIGHLSGMKLAVGVDHFIYGWVFFGVVIGLLFWLGSYFRDPAPAAGGGGRPVAPVPRASLAANVTAALGVATLAGAWPAYAAHLDREPPVAAVTLPVPAPAAGWVAVEEATGWRPQYVGSAASVQQAYAKDGRVVLLYVAYYRNQRQGAELVGSQNAVHSSPRWRYATAAVRHEDLGRGDQALRQTALLGPTQKMLVWDWYRIAGRELSDPYVAKALLARDKLLGRGDGSAALVLATPYEAQPEPAAALLRQFARDMRPSLDAAFAAVQGAPQ